MKERVHIFLLFQPQFFRKICSGTIKRGQKSPSSKERAWTRSYFTRRTFLSPFYWNSMWRCHLWENVCLQSSSQVIRLFMYLFWFAHKLPILSRLKQLNCFILWKFITNQSMDTIYGTPCTCKAILRIPIFIKNAWPPTRI